MADVYIPSIQMQRRSRREAVVRLALLTAIALVGIRVICPSAAYGAPIFSYLSGSASSQVPFGPADTATSPTTLDTLASTSNFLLGTFTSSTAQSTSEMRVDASFAPGWFTLPMGISTTLDQQFTVDQTMRLTLAWIIVDTNGEAGFRLYENGVVASEGIVRDGSLAAIGSQFVQVRAGNVYRLVLGFEDVKSVSGTPAAFIMNSQGTRFLRATVPTPGAMALMSIAGMLLLRRQRVV